MSETSADGRDAASPEPDEQPDHHHEGIEHETIADVEEEKVLLARAIGGWRGLIDSALPTLLFVVVYLVSGNQLGVSLWVAIGAAVLIAAWRLIRRESLQQVLAGLAGVAISAFVASRTGRAEDFFLWGLLTNIAYGAAFLVSILVRWPLVGVIVGLLTGKGTAWRGDPDLRRTYAAASWIWVGLFASRVVVQVPMYLAGWVGALGVTKVVMGWPFFLGAAYFTYLVLRPTFAQRRTRPPDNPAV